MLAVMRVHNFRLVPGDWSVVRLGPDEPVPDWALQPSSFFAITRTSEELSIVRETRFVPKSTRHQSGWTLLKVLGPFAFSEVGVLASLIGPLAAKGVPVFALSTFDTDYLLVPADRRDDAIAALISLGHHQSPP